MGMRLFPKRYCHRIVSSNSDEIISAVALPGGTRVNKMWIQCHVIITDVPVISTNLYGIHGYIVPILDPDSAWTPDAVWDAQVPKDQTITLGAQGLDLDTGAADTAPLFDIGQVNINKMVGETTAPVRFFKREGMMSWASSKGGYEDTGRDYHPSDQFAGSKNIGIEVLVPSVLLLGFSSPDTAQTVTTWPVLDSDADWLRIKYAEESLHQGMVEVMEGHEAGAESPWEDSIDILARYLEQAFEETAGAFDPDSFDVFCRTTFDITVPGRFEKPSLTAQA